MACLFSLRVLAYEGSLQSGENFFSKWQTPHLLKNGGEGSPPPPRKAPEWLWMVSQRLRRPLLALQTGYCSFRRISGHFLCKIEGQGNKFHLLRSLLSHFIKIWRQLNMQHWLPRLAPDAVPRITTNIWRWAHGEKDRNVRAIRPWMKTITPPLPV